MLCSQTPSEMSADGQFERINFDDGSILWFALFTHSCVYYIHCCSIALGWAQLHLKIPSSFVASGVGEKTVIKWNLKKRANRKKTARTSCNSLQNNALVV